METSLLFTIEVSARPKYSGDGNNELYTAQAMARNGEPLLYHGESATLSDALQQVVDTVKKQESRKADLPVPYRSKEDSVPLFKRFCRAIFIR
jgi:hypothetical protein